MRGKFGFRLIVLKKNIQEYYRYFFKVKKKTKSDWY